MVAYSDQSGGSVEQRNSCCHRSTLGIPDPRQYPDPDCRLFHRYTRGNHHSGADSDAFAGQVRRGPDPFRSGDYAQSDDRPAASAARHGAVCAGACGPHVGGSHHHGHSALAGAADAGSGADYLHSGNHAVASQNVDEVNIFQGSQNLW